VSAGGGRPIAARGRAAAGGGAARAASRGTAPRAALAYLRRATAFLEARGAATPRLDAEVLLATVLGTDRVGIYLAFDRPLAPPEVDAYRALVRRRAGGEPVAYLAGRREFWSRALAVSPAVLIPRPETELVVEQALAAAGERRRRLRVLDLGTGSGCLAIALAAELPAARVVAVDVSPAAAAVARANATAAGVADRVAVLVADWAAALAETARFDLVVSNPPYVATADLARLPPEVRREPRLALDGGPDGLAAYRRLAPAAARLLAPGGRLLVEIGEGQAAAVDALLRAAGFGGIVRYRDLAGVERVVAGSPG
jgi:release factor glutamine methyltransferase